MEYFVHEIPKRQIAGTNSMKISLSNETKLLEISARLE
jgi:hypothetical protein